MLRRTTTRLIALTSSLALTVGLGTLGSPTPPASALEIPPIPAIPGLPIPALPTDLLVPRFVGAPATAQPIANPPIWQNPHKSPNGTNSMHNDSYSSDAYLVSGPLGRNLQMTTASYGIRECATITFDSAGRIQALCGGLEGFVMMLIDPVTLHPIAELAMPGRDLTKLSNPFTDICGGSYFYLTADDRAIATTTTSAIWEVTQTSSGLKRNRSWELAGHIGADDCLIAVTPDAAGRVWFFTQQGQAGTLDRRTGAVRLIRLTGPAGRPEGNFNSVSADADGAVYTVTTHAMYRLDARRDGTPEITWRRRYDRGSTVKPGMLSQGSGTSPTLIGKRWVVIADNADPRMNIVTFDRRTTRPNGKPIRKRRHCTVPVFAAGTSTTENSLVAAGRSVMVENNYGYAGPQSTLFGQTTSPGFARVSVRPRGDCKVLWSNNRVSAPTSVPKASLGNGLVYAYTKPARSDGIDAWYFTALDIRTGKVAWSRLTGTGIQWNNHYASIYLGPDGTAYVATVAGLIRLADG
ncbi:hypothetical protein [Nocardioides limicola]|uniref:hypothetical protein n=1 Tax=Nocardioides limicola TaxID=2803368 RepID=UPI00193B1AFE|nr:hypothetical protein [Nocardioides sp. DJM-14]